MKRIYLTLIFVVLLFSNFYKHHIDPTDAPWAGVRPYNVDGTWNGVGIAISIVLACLLYKLIDCEA